jgi:hypothetical protein
MAAEIVLADDAEEKTKLLKIHNLVNENPSPLLEIFSSGEASDVINHLSFAGGNALLSGGFREFLETKNQKSLCLLLCPVVDECPGLSEEMLQEAKHQALESQARGGAALGETHFVAVHGVWYVPVQIWCCLTVLCIRKLLVFYRAIISSPTTSPLSHSHLSHRTTHLPHLAPATPTTPATPATPTTPAQSPCNIL